MILACGPGPGPGPGAAPAPEGERPPETEPPRSVTELLEEAVEPDAEDEAGWVERTLAALTLREKVAQMIMPVVLGDFAPEGTPGHDRVVRWIEQDGIGGLIVSVGSPNDVAAKLNDFQSHSRLPLLIAADLETGAGFRLNGAVHSPTGIALGGATDFPSLMALGATDDAGLAYEMGRITAVEARAVGIHVPFAPVLDVNANPANPVINTRSLGEDPARVGLLGAAFIQGVQEYGAVATAKHFPGHGDTEVDSHLGLPTIEASRARLDAVDLPPFRAAIEAGVGGIMTAHINVPSLNGGTGVPATLSRRVLSGLLREEMGFGGLIFTDALDMAAIDRGWSRAEASVLAVEAGADVVLQPPDVAAALDGILDAVLSGRIREERIDTSVRRILALKEALGLDRHRTVPLDSIPRRVGIPDHTGVADQVARRSLTLLTNGRGVLPLLGTRTARVLSVQYRRSSDLLAGRAFHAGLRARYPRLTTADLTRDTPAAVYEGLTRQARASNLVVVSLYVSAVTTAGSLALPGGLVEFVESLRAQGTPHVVVSFGSPYLFADLPSAQAFLLAYSGSQASQRAAVQALMGDVAITGRTPTRIPPYFDIGEGIELPARTDVGDAPGPVRASDTAAEEVTMAGRPTTERAPADLGLEPGMLARLDAELVEALGDGAAPGGAVAVGRARGLARLRGFGRLDWAEGAAPVSASTIYDLASLTKVVGTTTALMILVEEGRVGLDDRVVDHLPGWDRGDGRKARVTLRDLLLHRGGFTPFRRWFFELEGREAYRDAIYDEPLETEPGAASVYSDIGAMTLGLVVEAVTGTTLDAFLEERLFRPLGMHDTGFLPDPALLPRIAPTEVDTMWRGEHVRGRVHDENADAMGGVAGHAGLFSTARDLAVFANFLLRAGRGEEHLLSAETVAAFTGRHDPSSSRALGWDTPEGASSAGDYFGPRAFGHTGYTGTSIWIDPDLDLFVVLLTNRVNPTRDNSRHVPLRRAVHDLAAQSVIDRPVRRRRGGGS
jgi:beta-N-acetylhexosaminidase